MRCNRIGCTNEATLVVSVEWPSVLFIGTDCTLCESCRPFFIEVSFLDFVQQLVAFYAKHGVTLHEDEAVLKLEPL